MERVGVGACRRIGVGNATLKKLGVPRRQYPKKSRYADKRRSANIFPYAGAGTLIGAEERLR
jgi:hypothetical protein